MKRVQGGIYGTQLLRFLSCSMTDSGPTATFTLFADRSGFCLDRSDGWTATDWRQLLASVIRSAHESCDDLSEMYELFDEIVEMRREAADKDQAENERQAAGQGDDSTQSGNRCMAGGVVSPTRGRSLVREQRAAWLADQAKRIAEISAAAAAEMAALDGSVDSLDPVAYEDESDAARRRRRSAIAAIHAERPPWLPTPQQLRVFRAEKASRLARLMCDCATETVEEIAANGPCSPRVVAIALRTEAARVAIMAEQWVPDV